MDPEAPIKNIRNPIKGTGSRPGQKNTMDDATKPMALEPPKIALLLCSHLLVLSAIAPHNGFMTPQPISITELIPAAAGLVMLYTVSRYGTAQRPWYTCMPKLMKNAPMTSTQLSGRHTTRLRIRQNF